MTVKSTATQHHYWLWRSCIAVTGGETELSNEAAHGRMADVMAGLRDQLSDISAMQKKQAVLKFTAQAADGKVEATVDARGQLVKLVVDKSYLDNHDFENLGDHIAEAARAAAKGANRRVAEMLAPINERHKEFLLFSDVLKGVRHPKDLMPPELNAFAGSPEGPEGSPASPAGGRYDDGGDAAFPTVRR